MRKAIFLEYKFGDYDPETLRSSGATEVIAWMEKLTPARIKQLQGFKLGLSFSGINQYCPSDPQGLSRLENLLATAVAYSPFAIWIDSFRFDGHWESQTQTLTNVHKPCNFCLGKDRVGELTKVASHIRKIVPTGVQLSYFAVPYKINDYPELVSQLGQDHRQLAPYFDFISPMLYQRSINKLPSYISKYSSYLSLTTNKPIVPIIQVKDFPDTRPDGATAEVLRKEYEEAVKPPSIGVAWFSWDSAVEKHKTEIIAKIWV